MTEKKEANFWVFSWCNHPVILYYLDRRPTTLYMRQKITLNNTGFHYQAIQDKPTEENFPGCNFNNLHDTKKAKQSILLRWKFVKKINDPHTSFRGVIDALSPP